MDGKENKTRATRIVIADDHPIVRAGVRLLAESENGLELVGEASSKRETLQMIEDHEPDVLVLDLWLGKDDGMEILRELRRNQNAVRVLIYSMNDENLYGPRAMAAGADGYLMKDHGLEELAIAIDRIVSGKRYMSESFTEKVIAASFDGGSERSDDESISVHGLTDRELQILRLIGCGMSTGEVALSLGISPKTIGTHRENMKNKLGVGSAQELVRLAVRCVEQHVI